MKTFTFALAIGLTALASEARSATRLSVNDLFSGREGGAVGNGGGVIVCRNADHTIRSVELLDFFEARVLREIQINLASVPGTWKQKVQAQIHRLGKLSQLREELYTRWLNTFESEARILQGVTFNNIPDALQIAVPTGCAFEQAAVQIRPELPGDQRYYLNDELWSAMGDTQKAGLVMHELVYREALSYGHSDSVRTRYFVSMMNSSLIDQMDGTAFTDLLRQVHFELTEYPLNDSEVKTYFVPVNLWRGDFKHSKFPDEIVLQGKLVANVGTCRNQGCSQWEEFDDDLKICSGTHRIELGSRSVYLPRPLFESAGGKDAHCDQWTEIIESPGPLDAIQLTGYRLKEGVKQVAPVLSTVENGDTEYQYAWFMSFDRDSSSRLVLGHMSVTQYQSKTHSVVVKAIGSDAKNVFAGIFFQPNGQISSVSFNGVDERLKNAEIVVGESAHPSRFLSMKVRGSSDSISFDSLGRYRSGGGIRSIQSDLSKTIIDSDENGDGIEALQVQAGMPTMIRLRGEATLTVMQENGNHFSCRMTQDLYPLHSTLAPKMIVVAAPCTLPNADGKMIDLTTGSLVKLNERGRAIQ